MPRAAGIRGLGVLSAAMHRGILLLAVALLGSGCGSEGGTSSSITTTTKATTTSTVPPLTTAYRVDRETLSTPEPLEGSDSASGSGCTVGAGALPDGIWFGSAQDLTGSEVTLDLACFYVGEAAQAAAAEDGITDVPNDYYIRNQSVVTRSVPVSPGAMAWTLGTDPTGGLQEVAYSDWPPSGDSYTPCPGAYCVVWLYVNQGQITEIMEQYLP